MSIPQKSLFSLLSWCQKFLQSVEIWQSISLHSFFLRHGVQHQRCKSPPMHLYTAILNLSPFNHRMMHCRPENYVIFVAVQELSCWQTKTQTDITENNTTLAVWMIIIRRAWVSDVWCTGVLHTAVGLDGVVAVLAVRRQDHDHHARLWTHVVLQSPDECVGAVVRQRHAETTTTPSIVLQLQLLLQPVTYSATTTATTAIILLQQLLQLVKCLLQQHYNYYYYNQWHSVTTTTTASDASMQLQLLGLLHQATTTCTLHNTRRSVLKHYIWI